MSSTHIVLRVGTVVLGTYMIHMLTGGKFTCIYIWATLTMRRVARSVPVIG